ncbi:MAG: Peptide transporter ATP-binding protein [Chthonomonadaceae bacterium]|nr:Peptide transporter ATP-binding protein [Chthonomonadaceae bacterium]
MNTPLLQVENLRTYFHTPYGIARAVDGVSFTVPAGETVAIVGESGCGKSMTALSILQLVPEPAGYIDSGRILFEGKDLLDRTWDQMREVRGRDIAMIFQEPMTSLNAVFTIGTQLTEAMTIHGTATQAEAEKRAITLLERVKLPQPQQVMRQYPHELSGGMRQRVMIAMALANRPKLLIADEPTTALDVTVQAQILDLLRELQAETGMAVLMITHDLGIVARMATQVAVMYAGQVVETAPTRMLFRHPQHPYTKGLFASLPTRDQRGKDLATLEGTVPQSNNWPKACRFEPRCRYHWPTCAELAPRFLTTEAEHQVRCHLYDPEITDRPHTPLHDRAVETAPPVAAVATVSNGVVSNQEARP